MAAVNPNGGETYWSYGLPVETLTLAETGGERYWSSGLPISYLVPWWSNITKVNGILSSSLFRINGVSIAHISKMNGITI